MIRKSLSPLKLAFGFGAACLVVAWIGVAVYWSTHQLVRSFDSVAKSHQALEKIQSIQLLMESAESSVFTYVLTNQEDRLRDYRNAKRLVPEKLTQLKDLLQSPKQHKVLKRLQTLVSTHFVYLADLIDSRNNESLDSAIHWAASENTSSTRDALDQLLEETQKEANAQVQRGSTSTTQQSSKTTVALLISGAVSFGLLLLAFGLLRRESHGRQYAETTTQRTESFLDSIIDLIPYMIIVKEATNLRVTLVNKAATEWLGKTSEDLMGSNELDWLPKSEALLVMQRDRDLLNENKLVDIPEETLVVEGHESRILHTQKVIIPDASGEPAFLLTISEDITQRKQAERMLEHSRDTAVQSERLKAEFMRNMSHELRTPLAVVIGMISLLLDTELKPDQKHFATKVKNSADGLSKLTKDLLDFSRIETGTFTVDIQDMNLRHNIDAVVTMWTEQAKVKGVTIVSLVPSTVPALLLGDAIRLRQVLTQLIGNAVKFTPKGEIIVRVTETQQIDNDLWLKVQVSDTGIGIAPEIQEYIFQPFRQGDGSPTRKFGGTGLGLAMSKRIVELLGGEIGFDSAEGQGSTFWFTLPFKKKKLQDLPEDRHSPSWRQTRILVVEENETARQLLRQQLSTWGLANEGVSSGEQALELLRHEQKAGRSFPIVIVEMHLADMDSVLFARQIKNDTGLAPAKLIVLVDSPLDRTTIESLGFVGSIQRPVVAEKLYEQLSALIRKKKEPLLPNEQINYPTM